MESVTVDFSAITEAERERRNKENEEAEQGALRINSGSMRQKATGWRRCVLRRRRRRAKSAEQEHRAHEERAQREREEVERIEEQEKRERKEQLVVFYKRHGSTGLNQPRRS